MTDRVSSHSLEVAYERALTRYDGDNFEELREVEKVLVAIWGLEADVNNGGFEQFFFNSSGDHAYFVPTALELVGAKRTAALVRAANALFGPGGPPRDRSDRQTRLEKLDEFAAERITALDRSFLQREDDLNALVLRYAELHAPELLT